jgi:ribulose-5-phosphate 4-epimerase/fuculose-1-phosphate aldolase
MDEATARDSIVRVAALLWDRGLVAGTSGNLSVRLGANAILVTPTNRSLRDLRAEDLVVVDAAGISSDPLRSATSELPLHLAAYRVRADVACVVHTHPTYCTAWSKSGRLFPLETVGATESLGRIVFTGYARPGSVELAERCAEAFAGGADSVVMERHGLSSVAVNLERAFELTDLAEQTAKIEYCAATLEDE